MGLMDRLKDRTGFSDNTMDSKISVEERADQRDSTYKFIIAILVVAIGLMGVAYTNAANDRFASVEIPGTVYAETPLKVGNGWTNDMMMKVWADWMLNKTSSVTPGDVKENFNEVIRFFSQEKVSNYAGQLGALSNLVIRNQLKQQFTVKKWNATYYEDIDFQVVSNGEEKIRGAVFEYNGVATQSLGNNPLPDRECKYTIAIKFEGGHLYGYSYDTDCFK